MGPDGLRGQTGHTDRQTHGQTDTQTDRQTTPPLLFWTFSFPPLLHFSPLLYFFTQHSFLPHTHHRRGSKHTLALHPQKKKKTPKQYFLHPHHQHPPHTHTRTPSMAKTFFTAKVPPQPPPSPHPQPLSSLFFFGFAHAMPVSRSQQLHIRHPQLTPNFLHHSRSSSRMLSI